MVSFNSLLEFFTLAKSFLALLGVGLGHMLIDSLFHLDKQLSDFNIKLDFWFLGSISDVFIFDLVFIEDEQAESILEILFQDNQTHVFFLFEAALDVGKRFLDNNSFVFFAEDLFAILFDKLHLVLNNFDELLLANLLGASKIRFQLFAQHVHKSQNLDISVLDVIFNTLIHHILVKLQSLKNILFGLLINGCVLAKFLSGLFQISFKLLSTLCSKLLSIIGDLVLEFSATKRSTSFDNSSDGINVQEALVVLCDLYALNDRFQSLFLFFILL
mmetsp:Transcript_10744/g.9292  ORF Transcript_10744/g.9292 Transcript_10744/m.9292 type:complete len:273 (-) Transcript_10744:426-1244(-)